MPQEKKEAEGLIGSEDPQEAPKAPTPLQPIEITDEDIRRAGRPSEDEPQDDRGFAEKAGTTVARGVVKGLITEPLDMIGDVGEAVGLGEGFNDFLDAPDNFIDSNLKEVQGTGWQMAEGLVQFTAPFLATAPLAAITKGTKVAQAVAAGKAGQKAAALKAAGGAKGTAVKVAEFTAEASIRGAAVDFSSFDPNEAGLAEMAASTNVPGLKQLGAFLSVHDTDDRLEARFKRMGEGALIGVAMDGLFYSLRGAYRGRMASRMETAIKQGHATPSDVIKRDILLGEAGHGTDPAAAQVTHMVNDKGKWMLIDQVPEGWRFGGQVFEKLDSALKAGKKLGLREETLRESADRYRQAAEGDLRPLMEKKLVPDGTPGVKQKISEKRLRPDVIEEIQRNLGDVSKALDHADEKALPDAVNKLIDNLHMNWKHYRGREGDVAAPILMLQKLVKKSTLKDPALKRKVTQWAKDPTVSRTAKAQVRALQRANQDEMAFMVLTSEAVFTGQARHVSDITAKVRSAVETGVEGAELAAIRAEQKAEMLDLVRLQKEMQDYVGNIGRGLRANQLRAEVAEMASKGASDAEIDEFIKRAELEADEMIGEAFPNVPFKDAEEWLGAMDDVELQGLAEIIEISGVAPNFAAIIKQARLRSGDQAGSLWDAAMEWQVAGLLSGPMTHLKIAVSNLYVGFNETVWANAIGANMRGLSKADRKSMRIQAQSNLYGLFAYAHDGFIAAKTSWKHNLPTSDPYTVRNVISGDRTTQKVTKVAGEKAGEAAGKVVGGTGKLARTSFRVINFMDTYSKVVLAKQQARTAGLEKALKGGASFDEAAEFAERMATAAIDKNTGIILFEPGRKLGNKVAMMSPMNEGELAKGLSKMVQDNKILQPFIKFIRPANALMAYAAELAPEAVGKRISQRVRGELLHGGPQARARMQAKRYTAYTGLMLGNLYFMAGGVTAGGPRDPALRETWLETHRPFSVKIGDRWANYLWLPGVGMLAGMYFSALEVGTSSLSKAQQAYSNTDMKDVAIKSTLATTKALMEQHYLQGFVDFMDMLTSEGQAQVDAFANLTRGFAFSPLTQALSFDPHYRDAVSFTDQVKSRMPGLSRQVPERFDAYGRPLRSAYATPLGAADPTKLSQPVDVPDVLNDALSEMGVGFEAPDRFFQGKQAFDLHSSNWMGKGDELTPWERFNQLLREGDEDKGMKPLREALTEIVEQPQFRAVTDEDFRNRELASGRMSEMEYTQSKKALHSALMKLRNGYYQAGYGILRNEYPKLNAELGQLIEAEATGQTRYQ